MQFLTRKVGKSQTPKYLGILLHGYGSDSQDMLGLTQAFDHVLSDIIWICPNAPQSTGFGGYQWFPLSDLSPRELDTGAVSAFPVLNQFIADCLKKHEISHANLILGGFSQGAMMTLYAGLRQKTAPKALLAFSGALTAAARLPAEILCKPPVFIGHGTMDEVVLPVYADKAVEMLKSLDVPYMQSMAHGYGHTISPKTMQDVGAFLNTLN